MVSIIAASGTSSDKRCTIVCNSSDEKPTDSTIKNGSILTETDTASMYIYDETSKTWNKFN